MTEAPPPLWRDRMRATNTHFTEAQKQTYIDTLAQTGRKNLAREAAGVSSRMLKRHLEADEEFKLAVEDALEAYTDTVHLEVQRRAIDGVESLIYQHGKLMMRPLVDSNGMPVKDEKGEAVMIPATEVKYSDTLLKLEAQRVDRSFVPTHKSEVDVTHKGGVMIAPQELTPQQWIEQEQQRMLDDARQTAEEAKTLDLPALPNGDFETE